MSILLPSLCHTTYVHAHSIPLPLTSSPHRESASASARNCVIRESRASLGWWGQSEREWNTPWHSTPLLPHTTPCPCCMLLLSLSLLFPPSLLPLPPSSIAFVTRAPSDVGGDAHAGDNDMEGHVICHSAVYSYSLIHSYWPCSVSLLSVSLFSAQSRLSTSPHSQISLNFPFNNPRHLTAITNNQQCQLKTSSDTMSLRLTRRWGTLLLCSCCFLVLSLAHLSLSLSVFLSLSACLASSVRFIWHANHATTPTAINAALQIPRPYSPRVPHRCSKSLRSSRRSRSILHLHLLQSSCRFPIYPPWMAIARLFQLEGSRIAFSRWWHSMAHLLDRLWRFPDCGILLGYDSVLVSAFFLHSASERSEGAGTDQNTATRMLPPLLLSYLTRTSWSGKLTLLCCLPRTPHLARSMNAQISTSYWSHFTQTRRFPFYYTFKCAFIVWLMLPSTRVGAIDNYSLSCGPRLLTM